MHKYCTLVQANVDPQRLVGGLVANAGRSTRGLNLSHPASYTALTRTTLVPARRALAYFALLISNGAWEITSCVMLCSFIEVAKASFQWKPAANTGVLLTRTVDPPLA